MRLRTDRWRMIRGFALTPTVSPGEREKRSSPDRYVDARLDLNTRLLSPPALSCSPQRTDAVDARPFHHAAAEVPPLPGGEGWGEGEYGEHSPVLFPQVLPPTASSTR